MKIKWQNVCVSWPCLPGRFTFGNYLWIRSNIQYNYYNSTSVQGIFMQNKQIYSDGFDITGQYDSTYLTNGLVCLCRI